MKEKVDRAVTPQKGWKVSSTRTAEERPADRIPEERHVSVRSAPRVGQWGKIDAPQMTLAVDLECVKNEGRRDAAGHSGFDDAARSEMACQAERAPCEGRIGIVASSEPMTGAFERGRQLRPGGLELAHRLTGPLETEPRMKVGFPRIAAGVAEALVRVGKKLVARETACLASGQTAPCGLFPDQLETVSNSGGSLAGMTKQRTRAPKPADRVGGQ